MNQYKAAGSILGLIVGVFLMQVCIVFQILKGLVSIVLWWRVPAARSSILPQQKLSTGSRH